MGRLVRRMAVAAAGASPLLLASHAWAAATVRTPGSLDIREAATLSVVNQAPLQLLLSSGTDTTFTVSAAATVSTKTAASGAPIPVGPGPWAAAAATGEVLSVSLASADAEESGVAGQPQVRFIIAQFN